MLYDCHLNHMNEDELRNYAHKQKELEDSYAELLYAKDKVIESMQNLINAQQFAEGRHLEFTRHRDEIARIEYDIRQKYDKYKETPTCAGAIKSE